MQQTIRQFAATLLLLTGASAVADAEFADVVERIKPAIVGVGTFMATRRPPAQLRGTGFIVENGNLAVTNAHVIPGLMDTENLEKLVIFTDHGKRPTLRDASVVARDDLHDLAVLRVDGTPLPTMRINSEEEVREGQPVAFTGFPIGAVLGLFPVTHRGFISAITPIAIPARTSGELNAAQIVALRNPYNVLQLDATAYPGNSGSPVYRVSDGAVIGVINQVLVKGTKENVLREPSAITYAIPVRFLEALIQGAE